METSRVDRVNGHLDHNSLSYDHARLQPWSPKGDSQVSTFTVNFKKTDQTPMLWIESAKTDNETLQSEIFQTSDTPTRSFKSQFRSEVVLNDFSISIANTRHVVIDDVIRFVDIDQMTN